MTATKSLKKQKPTKLLWMDLEMTGLAVETEVITELAALITDFKLEVSSEFEAVVHYEASDLKDRFDKEPNGFWNSMPKERDKLLKACSDSKQSLKDIEDDLIALCKKNFKDEPVVIAGNSIRVDRIFIDKYMPRFAELLHYRMFDVSAFKIWIEGNGYQGRIKEERHRALYDIYESIEELKYYLEKGWLTL